MELIYLGERDKKNKFIDKIIDKYKNKHDNFR